MIEQAEGLYSRQRDLELRLPNSILIIGCGGVGSWVGIFAAMSGVQAIHLYDPDFLEESNRNRLPFCESSLNRPKVDVLADFIKGIRPEIMVIPIQNRITEELLGAHLATNPSWVIDCTDSPKTQIMTFNVATNINRGYIRAGYDGTHITVTSTVSGWIKNVEEETYEIRPSWVVPSAICGALAVSKLLKYRGQEVGLDISEIGIPALSRMSKREITARCYVKRKSSGGSVPAEVTPRRNTRRRRI